MDELNQLCSLNLFVLEGKGNSGTGGGKYLINQSVDGKWTGSSYSEIFDGKWTGSSYYEIFDIGPFRSK